MKYTTIKTLKNYCKRLYGWVLFVFVFFFTDILFTSEIVSENYYKFLFPYIFSFPQRITQLVPFPFVYLFIVVVIGLLIYRILKHQWIKGLNNIGFILFSFYLFWGMNYYAKRNFPYEVPEFISTKYTTYLKKEFCSTIDKLTELHPLLDSLAYKHPKEEVKLWLTKKKLPYTNGDIKILAPKGILLSFSTSGFYFPFVFEGYIDAGEHLLSSPFTVAHELAHCNGIAREDEANFTAYKACIQSNDTQTKYSAHLLYLNYLVYYLNALDKTDQWKNQLPSFIQNDMDEIRKEHDQYQINWLDNLTSQFYNWYLIQNNQEDGLHTYGGMVNLILIDKYGTNNNQYILKNKTK